MTFRAALLARLKAWPAVVTLAPKIRWTRSGAQDSGRRIVLRTVSQPRDQHLKGFMSTRMTRVQADCFGEQTTDGDVAEQLAEAVLAALAAPGTFGGVRMTLAEASGPIDFSEQTADGSTQRQVVDVAIWHNG